MSRPTAVSLFAGVGGIDIALERAGFHVTSAVEINAPARGVLADHFPNTTLHNDVTKVTADELRADGFVPERGVIAAGFPCQDLSVAGRRKGMGAGTRSGLYWHVVRLLAELRPRWVILENVPGLLSATCICPGDERCQDAGHDKPCGAWVKRNKRSVWIDHEPHGVAGGSCVGGCIKSHGGVMGAVLGSLGDLGYGFAYRVLDAQFFGVPQRRRRVVIVGCLGDDRRPVEVLLEPEGSGRDHSAGQPEGARVAATLTAGSSRAGVSAPGRRHEDDVNLVIANALTANGVGTCGVDDNQAQANHLVPVGNPKVAETLTACGSPEGGRTDKIPLATFQKVVRSGERDSEGNLPPEVWAQRDVAATLNCGDNTSESRATELVVTTLGDKTHALTAEGHDASEDGTGRGTPVVAFAWQAGGNKSASGAFETDMTPTLPKSQTIAVHVEPEVRRLTPRECERLQGFPDDWTATSNGKTQSDSPRYQQMGNAVAVPVFEWVARRIMEVAA